VSKGLMEAGMGRSVRSSVASRAVCCKGVGGLPGLGGLYPKFHSPRKPNRE
jgi:hypothetical protein